MTFAKLMVLWFALSLVAGIVIGTAINRMGN